eukprot:scaffold78627_cov55-Attheya_sp.AAC.1
MAHIISWDPVTQKAVSPNDAELEQMEEADALLGFDLDDEADDAEDGTGRLVDATPANALRSKMITGNKEVDTLGSYSAAQKGKPLPKAPPAAPKDSCTVISKDTTQGTQATSGTTKEKVSKLEIKLKAIAIKAGLWDSDDEYISTTLTQQEKVQYLSQKVAEVAKIQAAQASWQKQQAAFKSQATSNPETTKETTAVNTAPAPPAQEDVVMVNDGTTPNVPAAGTTPESAMEVDGEDPAMAEGEVATGTEDETPDTTTAGTTLESAVEVDGEDPAMQVAGNNPESAILLPGGS